MQQESLRDLKRRELAAALKRHKSDAALTNNT